jgi:hypothetical protein
MITTLITAGGIIFWIILGIVALIIAGLVEEDKTGKATFAVGATLALLVAFTDIGIYQWIKANPLLLAEGVAAYLGIALVWAAIKWRVFYLPDLFDRYEKLRSHFLKGKGLNHMPADQSVIDEFNNDHIVRCLSIQTKRNVRYNKARITGWMIYWPFSMVGTFIGDFMVRLFATMYKMLAGSLQRVSDRMASQYSELN